MAGKAQAAQCGVDDDMKAGFTTTILHSDLESPIEHNAVHKPMHPSVAFGYPDAGDLVKVFQGLQPGYAYGRQGVPTTGALESKITKMEDGIGTVSFATGMAAIASTFTSLLRAGDHVISSIFLFGNTNSVFGTLEAFGVEVSYVDATDVAAVEAALQPNTRMVFVETIANPRTQVVDLLGIGELCHARGLLYVVDNTMTSPYLFRPKMVGASLIINSRTKHINGHGNALGGAVTDTGLFDWEKYPNILDAYKSAKPAMRGLTQIRKKGLRDMGASLSAENAHRIAVGAETLALRQTRSSDNAMQLARLFASHPKVSAVYYPGLENHAQHARAKSLFRSFGSLLSIELIDGIDPVKFLNELDLVISSTHLGDNRTLAIPVATTIYFEMGAARRAQMGIADGLVRLSIGIEDPEDLLRDFSNALDAI